MHLLNWQQYDKEQIEKDWEELRHGGHGHGEMQEEQEDHPNNDWVSVLIHVILFI